MFDSRCSLGIDLRDDKLRLACLSMGRGGVKLVDYANFTLPPPHEGNLPEYESAVVEALIGFVTKQRVNFDQVIVGLPQKEVVFRRVDVPAVKSEELRQILEFEIERHVPFPAQEVYFDFKVIRPKEGNRLEAFFAAAKKERVKYLLSLLKKAGINYSGLELTTMAFFANFNFQQKNLDKGKISAEQDDASPKQKDNCLLVDVGFKQVELAVLQNGNLVLSHSMTKEAPLTISTLTEENDLEEMEKATAQMEEGSRKLAERLRKEINFLLISLQKTYQGAKIEHIFLGGMDVSVPLAEYLKGATMVETSLWDVLLGINAPDFEEHPLEGTVAIGLALEGLQVVPSGLNLLPPSSRVVKKDNSLVLSLVLGVILALLATGNVVSYFLKERLELKKVEEKIALIQPRVAEVEKVLSRYKKLREREKNLQLIARQPVSVLEVLKELTLKLPGDAWLERFAMNKKEIEIGGFAAAASNLIPVLEASPLFKNVKFTSAITSREEGKERFRIEINLERLKNEGNN